MMGSPPINLFYIYWEENKKSKGGPLGAPHKIYIFPEKMWKMSGGRNIAKWKEIDGQIGNLMGAQKKNNDGQGQFFGNRFFSNPWSWYPY